MPTRQARDPPFATGAERLEVTVPGEHHDAGRIRQSGSAASPTIRPRRTPSAKCDDTVAIQLSSEVSNSGWPGPRLSRSVPQASPVGARSATNISCAKPTSAMYSR